MCVHLNEAVVQCRPRSIISVSLIRSQEPRDLQDVQHVAGSSSRAANQASSVLSPLAPTAQAGDGQDDATLQRPQRRSGCSPSGTAIDRSGAAQMRISNSSLEAAPNTLAWFCRPAQAAGGREAGVSLTGVSAHNDNMQSTVSVSQAVQPAAPLVQGQHQSPAAGELPGVTHMCLLWLTTSKCHARCRSSCQSYVYMKDVVLVPHRGSQSICGAEA